MGFLVDGHIDWPWYLLKHGLDSKLTELRQGPFTLPGAQAAGWRLFGTALYCEDRYNGAMAAAHLEGLLEFTLRSLEGVELVRTTADLKRLYKEPQGPAGTFLILENADALADDPAAAEGLRKAGVLLVGLTHAGANRLAQGNAVSHAGGLTLAGRELLGIMGAVGMVPDAAHLHPRCFRQVLDVFQGPIVTSHTGLREACNLIRNLDLEQARELLVRGGMIGITLNPEMLTGTDRCDVEDCFRHIDLLVQKFGPDGIGLGSDFCGFEGLCTGARNPEEAALELAACMARRGYDRRTVDAVMGGNWMAFLERLLAKT